MDIFALSLTFLFKCGIRSSPFFKCLYVVALNQQKCLKHEEHYLSVQGEVVEDHGADEGDLGGLRVHDLLLGVHPQTRQLGQHVDHLQNKHGFITYPYATLLPAAKQRILF